MVTLRFPQQFFLYALLALLFSLALSPVIAALARRVGLIDVPGRAPHKQHQEPTPLAGGTVLMLGVIVLSSVFGLWREAPVRSIVFSSILIYLFGLLDDARGLSAFPKLFGQLVAGLWLISSGFSVHFIESIAGSVLSKPVTAWLDLGLTLFWLVGVTNAMNMIDSMDGLAAGLSAITFLFLLPVTLASNQVALTALSVILLGICIGLYYNNVTPARLFLGDSGAQTLGFLAASIAMVYAPSGLHPAVSWFVPILLVAIPIFDTTLVTVSRLRRGAPIYRAGRDHLYHRLVQFGMSPGRAVITIHVVAILVDCLAFVALILSPLAANLVFVGVLAIGGIALIGLERAFRLELSEKTK